MSNTATDIRTAPHPRLNAAIWQPWGAHGFARPFCADAVDAPVELLDRIIAFIRPLGWRCEVLDVCDTCDRDSTEVSFEQDWHGATCDDCLREATAESWY